MNLVLKELCEVKGLFVKHVWNEEWKKIPRHLLLLINQMLIAWKLFALTFPKRFTYHKNGLYSLYVRSPNTWQFILWNYTRKNFQKCTDIKTKFCDVRDHDKMYVDKVLKKFCLENSIKLQWSVRARNAINYGQGNYYYGWSWWSSKL